MIDFVCKNCGGLVQVEDGTKKVFCGHCGNLLYDAEQQQVYYARPVPINDEPTPIRQSYTDPAPATDKVDVVDYSTQTYDDIAAKNKTQKQKSPVIAVVAVVSVLAVIVAVAVLGMLVVKPSMDYNKALELMQTGEYEDAYTAFLELDDYKDSYELSMECKYMHAGVLYDEGAYRDAMEIYTELSGYSDSDELADKALVKLQEESIKTAGVGDIVEFGVYEQDNNFDNGEEVIEWQVLEVRGNQRLLISRYGIDCRQYDSRNMYLTWQNCQLRTWLNNDFMNAAFTPERQAMIVPTQVYNHSNPIYGTAGGSNTTDSIYLLSYNEASTYFTTNAQRQAQATAYTASKDAEIKYGNCWWWLRTPGIYSVDVCGVHHNGEMDPKGCFVYGQRSAVRPVMWVAVEE